MDADGTAPANLTGPSSGALPDWQPIPIVTVDSLCGAIEASHEGGAFLRNNFYNGLIAKCEGAREALVSGQINIVQNKLTDMQSQLEAQRGKGITEIAADTLLADIQYLLEHL